MVSGSGPKLADSAADSGLFDIVQSKPRRGYFPIMTRFASSLGLLGAALVEFSLYACGTNDHPTTPAPATDAGTQADANNETGTAVSPGTPDASLPP